jgi:NADH-quinone oxidoreductase subunit E
MSRPISSQGMTADSSSRSFAQQPTRETLPTNTGREVSDRANFRTSVINLDRPGDPNVFGDAVRIDAAELISRYPEGQARSALLPLLHLVQSEQGYVTPDGIAFCADMLGLTKAQVSAVATFYTMYKRAPTGEYLVSVCTNTLCGMLGGDEIFAALKDQLGVGNDQTTADGKITLEHAECLAACDYAPVVTVNYEFFDNQTEASAAELVTALQAGEVPTPTRGAPLCTFRQIERQIAGLHDATALAPDANGTGEPTLVGVKLAIERGDSAPSYSLQDGDPAPAEPNASEVAPSGTGEPASDESGSDEPASKDSAAKGGKRTRRRGGAAARESAGSAGHGEEEGPSESDAPLETAESDPAHSTRTDTEKGE